jgi:hypothetical protein
MSRERTGGVVLGCMDSRRDMIVSYGSENVYSLREPALIIIFRHTGEARERMAPRTRSGERESEKLPVQRDLRVKSASTVFTLNANVNFCR